MIKKVLTLAKNMKTFSLDDVLIMTGIDELDAGNILENLVAENKLQHKNDKYYFISQPAYSSTIVIKENKIEQGLMNYGVNFVDASILFLQNYANKNCSIETQRTYSSIFKNNLNIYFKDFLLEDITIDDVNKFRESSLRRCYSEKRIKNSVALLNQLLKYFRNSGYKKQLCEFQVQRVKDKRQKEIIILDTQTIAKSKNIAKEYSRTLYLIIEIIVNLGLKFYETLALTEADIDFKNKKILITKTSSRGIINQIKAKNQRRVLDFSEDFAPVLKEFVTHKRTSERMLRTYFSNVKKELRLSDFKMDDFRHTFASDFLQKGNSIEKLYLQLGDYSIQATMEKYKQFVFYTENTFKKIA